MDVKKKLELIRICWVEDENIEPEFITAQIDMKFLCAQIDEAKRLLGFAQFNLAKGKTEATKTLVDKAIVALGGEAWYNHDPNSPGEGFRRGGYLGDAID